VGGVEELNHPIKHILVGIVFLDLTFSSAVLTLPCVVECKHDVVRVANFVAKTVKSSKFV